MSVDVLHSRSVVSGFAGVVSNLSPSLEAIAFRHLRVSTPNPYTHTSYLFYLFFVILLYFIPLLLFIPLYFSPSLFFPLHIKQLIHHFRDFPRASPTIGARCSYCNFQALKFHLHDHVTLPFFLFKFYISTFFFFFLPFLLFSPIFISSHPVSPFPLLATQGLCVPDHWPCPIKLVFIRQHSRVLPPLPSLILISPEITSTGSAFNGCHLMDYHRRPKPWRSTMTTMTICLQVLP